jgi:feruloyl esterase
MRAASLLSIWFQVWSTACTVPDRTLLGNSEPRRQRVPEHGIYDALEHWVEDGTAPGPIVATKYVDDDRAKGVRLTRPLCPYPQIAKYAGNGDINDASD